MILLADGGWPRYTGSWSAVVPAINSLVPDPPCDKSSTAAAAVSATYYAGWGYGTHEYAGPVTAPAASIESTE